MTQKIRIHSGRKRHRNESNPRKVFQVAGLAFLPNERAAESPVSKWTRCAIGWLRGSRSEGGLSGSITRNGSSSSPKIQGEAVQLKIRRRRIVFELFARRFRLRC